MSGSARWLVVGGAVSPYVPALWAAVAARGDEVLLVTERRADAVSFEHEAGSAPPAGLRWLRLEGAGSTWKALRAALGQRPDVVVGLGYARPRVALALVLVRLLRPRARRMFMGDSNGLQWRADAGRPGGRIRARLKRWLARLLFHRAFHLGRTNELACQALGLESELMPVCAVDFEALGGGGTPLRPPAAMEGADRPRLVCVSRLAEVKNVAALAQAWREHCAAGGAGSLTVAGEGPERPSVVAAAAGLPARRLALLGAVPRVEIGAVIGGADALVLPSLRDAWGLVVVEALGLGVPVLASRWAGAAVSLQEAAPGAVRLCDPTPEGLRAGVTALLADLDSLRAAAARCAPAIREAYGLHEVAARLSAWGRAAAAQRGGE